ncbi:MAG: hypothetical protein E4H09_03890, partial [Spirochaetales bacterium]
HQGDEYTTIEIDQPSLPEAHLAEVERIANEIIEADLPVSTVWVDESTIENYPLRRPPKVTGSIRLVVVGDAERSIDCAACGGVHVTRTGQIRLVRPITVESIRGNARISFMIGDRALADYRMKDTTVREIGALLSAKAGELVARVAAQDEKTATLEAGARRLKSQLHRLMAESLLAKAGVLDSASVISAAFTDQDKDLLRGLTEILVTSPGVLGCLTNRSGDSVQWSIGAGTGVEIDANRIRGELLPLIGGKGGGKPPIWQGVGTDPSGIEPFHAAFTRMAEDQE